MHNEEKVMLELVGLKKYYPVKSGKLFSREKPSVKANDGISVKVYEGEVLGLVGESGCGKSTLGKNLLRIENPTAGEIYFRSTILYNDSLVNILDKVYRIEKQFYSLKQEKKTPAKCEVNKEAVKEKLIYVDGLIQDDAAINGANEELGRLQLQIKELIEEYQNLPEMFNILNIKTEQMRKLRTELQIIFQDPYASLNPRMTVGQLIGEPLVEHKMFKRGPELEAYIKEVMKKCGLDEYMIHRYPHQFSGGQRQRIGIARAIALKPKFIVCDEAVSALDVSIQSQIINLLDELKRTEKFTYIFITHDISVVKHISDRIGVMYLGNMVEVIDADNILEPSHPYTIGLLKSIPTVDGKFALDSEEIIKGEIPSNINPPKGCKFHTRCPYAKDVCSTDVPGLNELGHKHHVACHFPKN